MTWFNRWFGVDLDTGSPPKLARPAKSRVVWQDDGAGGLVSSDGYWHVRRVTLYHLERQGVDLGPWPELEQAQALAEIDDTGRQICEGSGQKPWRYLPQYPEVAECVECEGWAPYDQAAGVMKPHPAPHRSYER